MANLYEINDAILACVDMETGEIVDEDKLQQLQMDFSDKVEGIACWIKNLLSDAAAIKAEKDILAEREKACKNKAESLKRYLQSALDGEKFKTAKVSISYRKSESVQVDDITKLDEEYLKYEEPSVNKTKVKQALKSGILLQGVQLIENQNIQIK